jgi:peroxiredoxin
MLAEGATAPAIELERLGGGRAALPPGPVVVAFFKVSCPTCHLAFPYLERLSKGKLPIVAVSQNDVSATERFNQQFRTTFETLLDDSGYPASNAYGLTNVPSIFLIEADGRISLASAGFNKSDFRILAERAGVDPFPPGDPAPEWKPG